MYDILFVAIYRLMYLLFRNEKDEYQNKSDVAWVITFVTLIQTVQLFTIIEAITIYIGLPWGALLKSATADFVMNMILLFINRQRYYINKKGSALIAAESQLSYEKREPKYIFALLFVVFTIVSMIVVFNIHPASARNPE